MTNKQKTLMAGVAVLGALSILSGCATPPEYLDRHDRITLGAGDAVARNKAVHIINPTPRHAYRTHIHTDGERMRGAMENYHKVTKPDPVSSSTDVSAASPDADTPPPQ